MKTFRYLYGIMLGELLLNHADNLSWTQQHKSLSAADGQQMASMTVETLKGIWGDDLFWTKVTSKAGVIDVGEPALPWRRKTPVRFDDGLVWCKQLRISIVGNTLGPMTPSCFISCMSENSSVEKKNAQKKNVRFDDGLRSVNSNSKGYRSLGILWGQWRHRASYLVCQKIAQ